MKKLFALLAFLMIVCSPCAFAEDPAISLNRALSDSIDKEELAAVSRLLSEGADPNFQFLGENQNNPMCVATKPGKLEYLKALVEAGGDVNNLVLGYASFYSAPLSCAIAHGDFDSFLFLLDSGGIIDMELCTVCDDPADGTSLLQTAVDSFEYQMIWELIRRGARDKFAIAGVVNQIARVSSAESSADPYRQKIIEWLRKEGYEVDPKASTDR